MADVNPGDMIQITISTEPTSVAAKKTLAKLLSKDLSCRSEFRRLDRIRKDQYDPRRRGGRLYGGQMKKIHPFVGAKGESGSIRATPDVLRELASVSRFISVEKV